MTDARRCIDSNIWIYALSDQDLLKGKKARQLVKEEPLSICFSVQIVNETCYNLLRKIKMSESEVKKIVGAFFSQYSFVELNESVLLKASELRHKFSYWDSLVVASALAADCEILYSEDMQDGFVVEKKLTIINPFKV